CAPTEVRHLPLFRRERTVLTDHPATTLIARGSVVVGPVSSCDHEHVADTIYCGWRDEGAEESSEHSFVSTDDVGVTIARSTPPLKRSIRLGSWFKVDVQHPGLAPDVTDPVEPRVRALEHRVPMRGDIDHAVIGGEQGTYLSRRRDGESRVDLLEGVNPLGRGDTVLVSGLVYLWQIAVDERARLIGSELIGDGDALGRRLGGHEPCSAQRRTGEAAGRVRCDAYGVTREPVRG